MHPRDGELQAYLDHELEDAALRQVEEHLESCATCQGRAQGLQATSARVRQRLGSLTSRPQAHEGPLNVGAARYLLEARIQEKEKTGMSPRGFFAGRSRPAWALGVAVVAIGAALSFAPVRALAEEFLGLFRVEQIAVVEINPANLPEQLGQSSMFEQMLAEAVQFEEVGEAQVVASAAEAEALAGIQVRLPTQASGQPRLTVEPGGTARLTIDLPQVRALLNELGRSDIKLPDNLNGAEVTASLPRSVRAAYGNCLYTSAEAEREGARLANCTLLVQLASPTVSAPPDLDVDRIAEAFLQLSGLTAEEAARFSETVNWSTTLVIPIPRYGIAYEEVAVDGVTGVLFLQQLEDHPREYMLVWAKDGVVYALMGPGAAETALSIANSLE